MDIFRGSSQNWTYLEVISMHFRFFFLKVIVQDGGYFLGG